MLAGCLKEDGIDAMLAMERWSLESGYTVSGYCVSGASTVNFVSRRK